MKSPKDCLFKKYQVYTLSIIRIGQLGLVEWLATMMREGSWILLLEIWISGGHKIALTINGGHMGLALIPY